MTKMGSSSGTPLTMDVKVNKDAVSPLSPAGKEGEPRRRRELLENTRFSTCATAQHRHARSTHPHPRNAQQNQAVTERKKVYSTQT
jgi:hypothetical protein